jgi:hypothetical protein
MCGASCNPAVDKVDDLICAVAHRAFAKNVASVVQDADVDLISANVQSDPCFVGHARPSSHRRGGAIR